jgi:hypothetical protein
MTPQSGKLRRKPSGGERADYHGPSVLVVTFILAEERRKIRGLMNQIA